MSAHDCPIDRCETKVPRSRLMCKRHWATAPADLARAVHRAYRNGGVAAHLQACEDAIAHVEGRQPELFS